MSGQTSNTQPDQSAAPENQRASNNKPIVVGLYGVSGCGKTFLLNQLKHKIGQEHFKFYDGADMIADVGPGGLDAFQQLEDSEKAKWRGCAIDKIEKESADSGKVAIVAGHYMFWSEGEERGQPVWTHNDSKTFTHILYLDVTAEDVSQRRLADTGKPRPSMSVAHLSQWQQVEKAELRRLCYDSCILFSVVTPPLLEKVSMLLCDFQQHTETDNTTRAENMLDEALCADLDQLETVLVIDADKTLAAEDTGALFWKKFTKSQLLREEDYPLTTLFRSPMQYSYTAFRQAALLYEEAANHQDFDQRYDELCEEVASEVTLYAEFVSLLQSVVSQGHVRAVIVTCGLRRIWEKVLEREPMLKKVKVIGGGRIGDGLIVTAEVKAALVTHVKKDTTYVWAFGDSLLDLDMLSTADQAIVVVGEEQTRSKSMDKGLETAIDKNGLRARQAVLPSNTTPRLDTTKLPLVQLTDPGFVDSVLCHRFRRPLLEIIHATDKNATKLLATQMRDARVAGPALREAHRRVGWYLAVEYLTGVIGLEESPIQHVLGQQTTGSRLLHERQTTIVALMRGGEPMASGVNDAFPLAMFVHASDAADVESHHLEGQLTVILVDSVVNTGNTIVEFVQRIRKLHATIRIVVVAGVVQAKCISGGGLKKTLAPYGKIHLIALRLSDTSFVGSRTTDTGNRLFNTTHLP